MAQVIGCLLSKREALSSTPNTAYIYAHIYVLISRTCDMVPHMAKGISQIRLN
jgi:hypothetical protein